MSDSLCTSRERSTEGKFSQISNLEWKQTGPFLFISAEQTLFQWCCFEGSYRSFSAPRIKSLGFPSVFLVNPVFPDRSLFPNLPDLTAPGNDPTMVTNAGCVLSSFCNSSFTGSILGVDYSTSFQCCDTDLCNHASSLQLHVAALCLGTVTWLLLWSPL